jgi:hypothetical protein
LPDSSNALGARGIASRPPNQVTVPSVRSTGNQAAWLSTVPKALVEIPIRANGRPPNTRLTSAGGRPSQSIAFLKTPGRLLWYSGVASSTPSQLTMAFLSALTAGGIPCASMSPSNSGMPRMLAVSSTLSAGIRRVAARNNALL